jgi:hypothetical protein
MQEEAPTPHAQQQGEALTLHVQQLEHEPHWLIQLCLRLIGTTVQTVNERFEPAWLLLLWLGPVHWLRVTALVCAHSSP